MFVTKGRAKLFWIHDANGQYYKDRALDWHVRSAFWFIMSLVFALGTPWVTQSLATSWWQGTEQNYLVWFIIYCWPAVYFAAFVMGMIQHEQQCYSMFKERNTNPSPRLLAILKKVSRQAGIETPHLIHNPQGAWSAAATRSFICGRKILWSGSDKFMTDNEVTAVIAHEVGHFVMRDIRTMVIKHCILGGMKMLKKMLFVATIYVSIVWMVHLVPYKIFVIVTSCGIGFSAAFGQKKWLMRFLLVGVFYVTTDTFTDGIPGVIWFAMMMSFFGSVGALLCSAAYSRIIEYRTDAVGVDIIGQQYAADLVSALDKVMRIKLSGEKTREIYEALPDILLSHPRNRDRARSLGIRRFLGECVVTVRHRMQSLSS